MVSSLLPPDFFQNVIASTTSFVVDIFNSSLRLFLVSAKPYLPYILAALFILLIITTLKAMLGEWGALGSLLYHILYFGGWAIIIWLKGFEIFFNPFVDLLAFALYKICFWIVGTILRKVGFIG